MGLPFFIRRLPQFVGSSPALPHNKVSVRPNKIKLTDQWSLQPVTTDGKYFQISVHGVECNTERINGD